MNKIICGVLIFLWGFLLSAIDQVPGQMIVKTSEAKNISDNKLGLQDLDNYLSTQGLVSLKPILNKQENNYFLIKLSAEPDWDYLRNIDFPGVRYIQPNYINEMHYIPNDPHYEDQEINYENVNLPQTWNYTTGNPEILIAIIDSGLHFQHPDLQNNVYINQAEIPDDGIDNDLNGYIDDWRGWDFTDAPGLSDIALGDFLEQDNDPSDDINHGTHIAGIIGADTNNGIGVSGICWDIDMLIIRAGFLTTSGIGFLQDDDAAAGVIYAADMGADVINISWGDENYSPIIADACQYALDKGSIIVASSGNNFAYGLMYPAKLASTIAVGSVDRYLDKAEFSCYGPELDIVAPGVNIFSTFGEDEENPYYPQSGTSMSAPFVSAALGLLFSVESGLTFNQVKSRLHATAIDLGEEGFDNEHGSGLIDIHSLLTESTTLEINIDLPADFSGHSTGFDLIGTVTADNFSRYNVMYTTDIDPTIADWYDVTYPHSNTPVSYQQEVFNDVIAHFDVEGLTEELNLYTVKVELITDHNNHYEITSNFYIDLSEPVFKADESDFLIRYDEEYVRNYVKLKFNEAVSLELSGYGWGNFIGNFRDSLHYVPLGDYWYNETLQVAAENICGLPVTAEITPQSEAPDLNSIDVNRFTPINSFNHLILADNHYDFDNNGYQEFWALSNDGEEDFSAIYEMNNNEIITKHTFSFDLWPHALGNTNATGIEVLGLNLDYAYLYESNFGSEYPNDVIWIESNAYGGSFINYDEDEYDEIALIKNETINSITRRVIALYNRSNNVITKEYILLNQTPTSVNNVFRNRVESADLNNNGLVNILAADQDGDIMVFEYSEATDEFEMIWYYRLPVENTYYLVAGDFTGDGSLEFCAGGYTLDYNDPAKTFSHFQFFGYDEIEEGFIKLDYLEFEGAWNKNSLLASDLDGDNDLELIFSLPPDAYVVDYIDAKFKPIWKGSSTAEYNNNLMAVPASDSEEAYFLLNSIAQTSGEIETTILQASAIFTGPETPGNFTAQPLNENNILLNWTYQDEAESYNIYRLKDGNESVMSVTECSYLDNEHLPGDSVSYRITAVNNVLEPAESLPTLWKSAIPDYPPQLESITMTALNALKLKFDRPLSNSAFFISHYLVSNSIGYPADVNIIEENTEVLLSFQNYFGEFDQYQISLSGLFGKTGVPVAEDTHDFNFTEDTDSPFITEAQVMPDKRSVKIHFNEAMASTELEDPENYTLIFPDIDQNNQLIGLEYRDDYPAYYVILSLQNEMKYTNQSYFLKIENGEDISGNKLANHGNKCRFSLTDIKNLDYLIVYPNPLNLNEIAMGAEVGFKFINLPLEEKGNIKIYDLSGDLVFRDRFGPYFNANDYYHWDVKNNSGNKISSGVYYYVLEVAGDIKQGKLVLIN